MSNEYVKKPFEGVLIDSVSNKKCNMNIALSSERTIII